MKNLKIESKMNYTDSWKNKEVFQDQLALNKRELKSYPTHWWEFLNILKHLETKNILDVGCGAGAMSELCSKHLPDVTYVGMDYSEDAIEIARKEWPQYTWYVKDYSDLDPSSVSGYDTLHAGAFLDVLPNGDEALEHLLSLGVPNIFIGRAKISDKASYYTTYEAYNKITTYAYHHNHKGLVELAKKYGYGCLFSGDRNQCNIIFQKNQ